MAAVRLPRLAGAALVLAAFAAPASPVQAQSAVALGSADDPFWGRKGNLLCRRWCLEDRNPCDSVQFKAADGRCDGTTRTFFGVLNCRIHGETRPECPTAGAP